MLIGDLSRPTVFGWIVLGPAAALLVTFGAGRRRWFALAVAGLLGWTMGVVSAGVITGWDWAALEMILLALLLGTLFTMIAALGIDLLARSGRWRQGRKQVGSACATRCRASERRSGRRAVIARSSDWPGAMA